MGNTLGFIDKVRTWWTEYRMSSNDIWVLKEKFKRLKRGLKVWNRDIFGHLEKKKHNLIQSISRFGR